LPPFAVVTTGIYCQPGCSARPLARNVLTFEHPAAAEAAGFRACHRCRPYRIGLSARHLRRLFRSHLGATPDQLEVFREAPTDLRNRRHRADRLAADGGLTLRLPVVPGYDWDTVRGFLAVRLIPRVEAVDGTTYRRTISVAGAPGLLEVSPGPGDFLLLRVHLPYWEGLIHIVERAGRLLGTGGLPGVWNSFEAGVWAILTARPDRDLVLTDFVTALGVAVPGLPGGLTHAFPDPLAVTAPSVQLGELGLSTAEAEEVRALGGSLVSF
jgi:AraC family transcriptional regulator of adaptative response / DNA-3-methyladenine glycosylase II